MHEKMTKRYFHVISLLLSLFISGCTNRLAIIKDAEIENETRLNELSNDELNFAIHLNQSEKGNIFNSSKGVTINGYRILYHSGNDEILIIKNKRVISSISNDGNYIVVYKNISEAPSLGSEKIIFIKNSPHHMGDDKSHVNYYLSYSGDKYTFEDFGLNGVDVIYNNNNSDMAQSFIPGKICKTLTARVACCQNVYGQFLDGYHFTYKEGWKLITAEGFSRNCRRLNDTTRQNP